MKHVKQKDVLPQSDNDNGRKMLTIKLPYPFTDGNGKLVRSVRLVAPEYVFPDKFAEAVEIPDAYGSNPPIDWERLTAAEIEAQGTEWEIGGNNSTIYRVFNVELSKMVSREASRAAEKLLQLAGEIQTLLEASRLLASEHLSDEALKFARKNLITNNNKKHTKGNPKK